MEHKKVNVFFIFHCMRQSFVVQQESALGSCPQENYNRLKLIFSFKGFLKTMIRILMAVKLA